MAKLNKIAPCLWFDSQAEEAARFYVSLFEDSGIDAITHYGKAGYEVHGRPAGSVMTVNFRIAGAPFTALNGGPQFKFTEAFSLQVYCADQPEIDRYTNALTAGGGSQGPCGWVKDRYGLSWQVVPAEMDAMMTQDAAGERTMAAMLQMKKLDLAALRKAHTGT